MQSSKLSKQFAVKMLAATALLSLLAAVAGSQLAPSLPLYSVLLYSAVGAVVLFFALVVGTVATLTVAQFILRKGGTDPQWFWFPSEPKGLVQLRAQTRVARVKTNR